MEFKRQNKMAKITFIYKDGTEKMTEKLSSRWPSAKRMLHERDPETENFHG